MSVDAWLMVGILVTMFAFLAWDRFPAWLVFMGTLTTAMTLKLAPAEALLTGFSNTGVMTVAALVSRGCRHVCHRRHISPVAVTRRPAGNRNLPPRSESFHRWPWGVPY